MDQLQVISLDELKQQGTEIIPMSTKTGGDDTRMGVRVKRLSILGLCQKGKIPNNLLGVARQLFYNEEIEKVNMKDYGDILEIVSKEVLVEPTYEQFEEFAPLTDDQKFELYIYSQRGLDGLENFRKVTKINNNIESSEQVQNETESDLGDKE